MIPQSLSSGGAYYRRVYRPPPPARAAGLQRSAKAARGTARLRLRGQSASSALQRQSSSCSAAMMLLSAAAIVLVAPLLSTTSAADSGVNGDSTHSISAAAAAISVVRDIPGRARSRHYAVSAQGAAAFAGESWQEAFVLETTAKDIADAGYFSHLNGFTNSWASVMLGPDNTAGVRLRVSRFGGAAIKTARASLVIPLNLLHE